MLPCSMIRSLSPRAAWAAGKSSASLTSWVPCSITSTSSSSSWTAGSLPTWASSWEQNSGRFIVVMPMVTVPGLRPLLGYDGRPLGALDDDVLRAGEDVEPVPAAVTERLERQVEGELAGALVLGGGGVDALGAAVGHRPVDDQRRLGAGDPDREPAPS